MATVLLGAAIAGLGSAAAGATVLGLSVLGTSLAAAALGGAVAYMSSTSGADSSSSVSQVQQISDKTVAQSADQLDAAQIGEEESEKRKRKSAKSKFKIEKEIDETASSESGVAVTEDPTDVTGVQI